MYLTVAQIRKIHDHCEGLSDIARVVLQTQGGNKIVLTIYNESFEIGLTGASTGDKEIPKPVVQERRGLEWEYPIWK